MPGSFASLSNSDQTAESEIAESEIAASEIAASEIAASDSNSSASNSSASNSSDFFEEHSVCLNPDEVGSRYNGPKFRHPARRISDQERALRQARLEMEARLEMAGLACFNRATSNQYRITGLTESEQDSFHAERKNWWSSSSHSGSSPIPQSPKTKGAAEGAAPADLSPLIWGRDSHDLARPPTSPITVCNDSNSPASSRPPIIVSERYPVDSQAVAEFVKSRVAGRDLWGFQPSSSEESDESKYYEQCEMRRNFAEGGLQLLGMLAC